MLKKHKILIFIDWYKPGFKAGGPIRSISNFVDYFANTLDIFIITRDTDYLEKIPYKTIKYNQWNTIDGAQVYYLSKENQTIKTIKRFIKEVNPKIIYCNSLYSPFYTLIPLFFAKKYQIKSILAVRGMLSKGSLGVKLGKKKLFILFIKISGIFKKSMYHATTFDEQKDIKNIFGQNTAITIAQNLPERKKLSFQKKQKNINQLKLVCIGRIAPEKNTLYALEILKEVKLLVTFDIYGPIYNQEYWQKCKNIINQLPSNIVVSYKGVLPHKDLDNTLKKYHVFFSPSTGENFGHSIIEAMINSCISIISDKTPWKNLEQKKVGFDLSLNDKGLFAKKIDLIASFNVDEFNLMSLKSYQYAHTIIFNDSALKPYHKLFQLSN